jgi:membrane protein required for colicin V production
MTGLDYVVLIFLGIGAIGGFMRGFIEEVLSLASWCLALLAVHYFHAPLTLWLAGHLPTETGAGVLAFFLLLLIPYIATRMVARRMGSASRDSAIGPIDRVLGFGFGAVKGFIIVVLGYSLVVFAYDLVWGEDGRPQWIVESRAYPFLNAASEELLTLISERREAAADQAREVAKRKARHQLLGD